MGAYTSPMRLIADLHIHSKYSRATSPKLTPPHLERWARIKGIDLVGTGDCTHPAWLSELRESVEPAGEGFFRLKDAVKRDFEAGAAVAEELPQPAETGSPWTGGGVRFVLSGEISTIYRREGKTRKVHHVVILPDFAAAAAFQASLERAGGNIRSDGRPILGMDSRDLFSLLLEADERAILLPAHIWTPWFSALGSRSGFDSIDECYGDLAPRIGAIETGLSSNPPMNWAVGSLDRFAIVSNSDAHSPDKLGREATILEIEPSFAGLYSALSGAGGSGAGRVAGTLEFFPQEGKYHYDGHRACGVVLSPEESAARGGLCPVCGKPLTPGVMRRVAELADRPVEETAPFPAQDEVASANRQPYRSLVPLPELLGELLGTGPGSKKVAAAYNGLVGRAGSEFSLLLESSVGELGAMDCPGLPGPLIAEAIERMRAGRVSIRPGFDGEYGVVRVFAPGERIETKAAKDLFDGPPSSQSEGKPDSPPGDGQKRDFAATAGDASSRATDSVPDRATKANPANGARGAARRADSGLPSPKAPRAPEGSRPFALDPAQAAAVEHAGGPALVIAGPGTGKTAVLAARIARRVGEGVDPPSILAVTFTNKAAGELRRRIASAIGSQRAAALLAATFHSFCLSLLRERGGEARLPPDFNLLDEERKAIFLAEAADGGSRSGRDSLGKRGSRSGPRLQARRLGDYIEGRKRFLLLPGEKSPRLGPSAPEGLAALAAELGIPPFDPDMDAAYARYRLALRGAAALDFDDLAAVTVRLLSAKPAILSALRTKVRAVFVDEYQDVNFAQYALIRLLSPGAGFGPELFVIGDPDQAIYGFRGSDRRFIDRFLTDYPGASVHRLSKSFRCAPAIIGAAGRLVGTKLAGSGGAVALSRAEYPTDKSEAEGIAREIDRLIGGTGFFALDSGVAAGAPGEDDSKPGLSSLGECAILVRASALAPVIAAALDDHGLPYRLVGEKPWWEEEPALGILERLRSAQPSGHAARPPAESPGLRNPDQAAASLPPAPYEAVLAAAKAARRDPRDETVERLAAMAAAFPDLRSFLDATVLGSPQDGLEVSRAERVSLMTIHAAKGLEFEQVFVAGLEDGILPFTLFDRSGDASRGEEKDRAIDEERRLLYVAMTRAKIGLHLSWARSRIFKGRRISLPPSRFLSRVEDLLPMEEAAPRPPADKQPGLF